MPILQIRDGNGSFVPIPAITGKSAYEQAVEGGYTGTEEAFIAALNSLWGEESHYANFNNPHKVTKEQLGLAYYETTGEGSSSFEVTIPGITELKDGVVARIIPHVNGTGLCTLKVNGIGNAWKISQFDPLYNDTSSLPPKKGVPYELFYSSSREEWVCYSNALHQCILDVYHGGTGNSGVDTVPTLGSTKMVTSDGIYKATAKISYQTYTGTGKSGKDNPNKLYFNLGFEPKGVYVVGSMRWTDGDGNITAYGQNNCFFDLRKDVSVATIRRNDANINSYLSFSCDKNEGILSWYLLDLGITPANASLVTANDRQLNSSAITYSCYIFG